MAVESVASLAWGRRPCSWVGSRAEQATLRIRGWPRRPHALRMACRAAARVVSPGSSLCFVALACILPALRAGQSFLGAPKVLPRRDPAHGGLLAGGWQRPRQRSPPAVSAAAGPSTFAPTRPSRSGAQPESELDSELHLLRQQTSLLAEEIRLLARVLRERPPIIFQRLAGARSDDAPVQQTAAAAAVTSTGPLPPLPLLPPLPAVPPPPPPSSPIWAQKAEERPVTQPTMSARAAPPEPPPSSSRLIVGYSEVRNEISSGKPGYRAQEVPKMLQGLQQRIRARREAGELPIG